ncbi:MAG: DUF1566 domain-containing protein [Candidatus Latescibacteria bacterium]|nr:DUF1566 domain-containing protein [Candidatus Latescibacterota bacterium]
MKTLELRSLLLALALAVSVGCSDDSTNPASGDPGEDPPEVAGMPLVDTGQELCYDDQGSIPVPSAGQAFYGQDSQYDGNPPSYSPSDDGLTVYDRVTGLTWQRSPDTNGDGEIDAGDKLTWDEARVYPATLNEQGFGGFTDWRLPTIKELYSLIDFRGVDPSGYNGGTENLVPFLDTDAFEFAYGDEEAGERIIDSQWASRTLYVGTVFDGQAAAFGVNFADGRIKGYPVSAHGGREKTFFVVCTRGNPEYGINQFVDNGDGTITDLATGLMWQQADSGEGLTWEEALAYCEDLQLAGHSDWRLPNAKELQSIVDYERSPSTTASAAIDPLFDCTAILDETGETNYPFYWTGTTHANLSAQAAGANAVYVAFGDALGYMFGGWTDVHGAGAQRSDPKSGDPADWPTGHGPQGDCIRIYNHARAVRSAQ